MSKRRWYLFASFFLISFISCLNPGSKIDPSTYEEYKSKGDEITGLAQATLLSNVGKAMQSGGAEYAVEFCNLKASSIVDSLNAINNCLISRVSERNRNPENNIDNEIDRKIIQLLARSAVNDTLIHDDNKLVYFKSIRIALPTCLKCHGNPEQDIDIATINRINQLYPNDLATRYQLNEFRGMWRVEFNRSSD